MTLKIALEWFLNPDHLPFIAGIVTGRYQDAGLDIQIIQPQAHYDGFKELQNGAVDIHINEPIHLFEHYFDGLKSLGCFFETRGGIMLRADRITKLQSNAPIKITTPAANSVTNKIGFEILKRYALKNGFSIEKENVEFVETDFWHVANMLNDASFDAAWLCFYNFEGIEAQHKGFENIFIDQFESPYPNFSALELMTTQEVIDRKSGALCRFIEVTNDTIGYLQLHPTEAKDIYYQYAKETKTSLMDKIIVDSIMRFDTNIKADAKRWRELYKFLEDLEVVMLSDDEYYKIFTTEDH